MNPITEQEVRRAFHRRRSACIVVSVLLVLTLFPSAAAAAEILIDPKVGFHGVFQLGRPFPLEVSLQNLGRPADGILEVQVWKGGATQGGTAYRAFHRREVFLPARAQRTVQFTIDPDLLSRPLRIEFRSADTTASREIDLRRHFSSAPVVLSVSGASAVPLTALGASLTHRIVGLTLAELPAEARALRGVSHLVIYDQSLRDLSRTQVRALDDWLAAGGRMVIIGSLNFTLYQEPQLARYLPVRVTGIERTAFAYGPAGNGASISGVWAQRATVLKGRVVTQVEGLPVVVEDDWGRGKVVYLALDAGRPPLATWSALPSFLETLLAPAAAEKPSVRTPWSKSTFAQVLLTPSFVSTYIPTRALFLAIAAYLGGIIVLAQLWHRGRMTRRALAIACCGWIVCAAAAGYLYFSRGGQSPDGVLLTATVMENAGDGYVEAHSNLALFSTQMREYSLAFERGWVEAMPLTAPSAEPPQPLVYRHGGAVTRVQLPLEGWDFRLLRARYVERLRLTAAIERQDAQLVLKVHNQSGKDLTDCWLLAPGTRIALGDLPKGESWTKTFPLGVGGDGKGRTEDILREIKFNDKPRDVLFHSAFFPQESAQLLWPTGAAVFFGWVQDPEPPFDAGDASIHVQSYALFRAIVPLLIAEDE